MRFALTPSRSSAFLTYVSTSLRISFLIVRSDRTLGVFVAINPARGQRDDSPGQSTRKGDSPRQLALLLDLSTDNLADGLVQAQHVEPDTAELWQEE
jgi:hypothetical protein